jgi:hypothetical protein
VIKVSIILKLFEVNKCSITLEISTKITAKYFYQHGFEFELLLFLL